MSAADVETLIGCMRVIIMELGMIAWFLGMLAFKAWLK
jgi:hypothetical protein